MSEQLCCTKCGHTDAVDTADAVLRCDVCGARIAYGQQVPRIVVEPHADARLLKVSVDGIVFAVDKPFAAGLANNLLALAK